jgi:hypothetical protein
MNFFAKRSVAAPAPAAIVAAAVAPDAPSTAPAQDVPAPAAQSATAHVTYARIDLHTGEGSLTDTCTGEDYEEFVTYLRVGKRPHRRTGVSVKDEFEMWLADRARILSGVPEKKPSGLSRLLQVRRNLN